jgi:hypothetical protein
MAVKIQVLITETGEADPYLPAVLSKKIEL